MSKALASAGASNQPARAPQPVEGKVLAPVQPRAQAAEGQTSPAGAKTPPAAKEPLAKQSPPPEASESHANHLKLITFLAGTLCGLAFLSGLLWRAARHRRMA